MGLLARLRSNDDTITAWAKQAKYGTLTEAVGDDVDYNFSVQAKAERGEVVSCVLCRRAEEDRNETDNPFGIVRRDIPVDLASLLLALSTMGYAERMQMRDSLAASMPSEQIDLMIPDTDDLSRRLGPTGPDPMLRSVWEGAGDGTLAAVAATR